jgi:cytochrome P450
LHEQIVRDGVVDISFQVAQGTNLVIAGAETTAHVLTNTMMILARNPALQDRVRNDHALLRPLFEESMRLETPVQWLPRLTATDAVVGNVDIPAGSTLWLLWGAGNRDADKWPDPENFDLDRPNLARDQLGFGRGPHLCSGAPLARLEMKIAFERLLTRLENLRVLEDKSDLTNIQKLPPSRAEGVFDGTGTNRGPTTLVVAFDRAAISA